jgi:hypothetical protein
MPTNGRKTVAPNVERSSQIPLDHQITHNTHNTYFCIDIGQMLTL